MESRLIYECVCPPIPAALCSSKPRVLIRSPLKVRVSSLSLQCHLMIVRNPLDFLSCKFEFCKATQLPRILIHFHLAAFVLWKLIKIIKLLEVVEFI